MYSNAVTILKVDLQVKAPESHGSTFLPPCLSPFTRSFQFAATVLGSKDGFETIQEDPSGIRFNGNDRSTVLSEGIRRDLL